MGRAPANRLKHAEAAAREAGRLLMRRFRGRMKVGHKGVATDLVTDIDRASERLIAKRLLRAFPDDDILAEEDVRRDTGSRFRWIVDPLDGTVNYVHGFPLFAVSIALAVNGAVEAGVVHVPALDQTFAASRGRGARLNGRPIRVSATPRLPEAFLVTGFPYFESGRDDNLRYFAAFLNETRAIRRVGSASIDLCYTACGIFDGFWEFALKSWDIAAGVLVVQEAGGRATRFDGTPVDLEMGEILATNGRIHGEMKAVLQGAGGYRAPPG